MKTTKKNKILKKKGKMSAGKMMAIGAGVAIASAGAYALMGPNGKKNQKKVKSFVKKIGKKAKNEIKKDMPIVKKELRIVGNKIIKPAIKEAKRTAKKIIKKVS